MPTVLQDQPTKLNALTYILDTSTTVTFEARRSLQKVLSCQKQNGPKMAPHSTFSIFASCNYLAISSCNYTQIALKSMQLPINHIMTLEKEWPRSKLGKLGKDTPKSGTFRVNFAHEHYSAKIYTFFCVKPSLVRKQVFWLNKILLKTIWLPGMLSE